MEEIKPLKNLNKNRDIVTLTVDKVDKGNATVDRKQQITTGH